MACLLGDLFVVTQYILHARISKIIGVHNKCRKVFISFSLHSMRWNHDKLGARTILIHSCAHSNIISLLILWPRCTFICQATAIFSTKYLEMMKNLNGDSFNEQRRYIHGVMDLDSDTKNVGSDQLTRSFSQPLELERRLQP